MKAEKTRGNKNYTESAFWSMIRSGLRQKSRWWPPISLAKQNARRPYKGMNKRQKYEYKCNICNNWFPDKEVEVDHIIEAGSLQSGKDLEQFVERLFCEVEGLQVVCKSCHQNKTNKARKSK